MIRCLLVCCCFFFVFFFFFGGGGLLPETETKLAGARSGSGSFVHIKS